MSTYKTLNKIQHSDLYKLIYPVLTVIVYFVIGTVSTAADEDVQKSIGTGAPTDATLGNISTLDQLFYWIVNLMKYIGWAGVLIGVFIVLALLVYKLIAGDDEATMKKVTSGITRAVIIVVIGILLLGGSFIISQIANLIGASAYLNLESGDWVKKD